jgi:lipopolysaccharide/colanic/teichoic acid biosynthesis glycosyltransferase
MEEVLEWMTRMEQAADKYLLSDYERKMSQFTFNEEMARWIAQNPVGVTRWYQIWGRMREIEEKRDRAWQEIYRMDQFRTLLDWHLIKR